ncbi:MAG: hypothetical protein M3Q94_13725, partial [Pseudomonadota bacterium]|nr:hypothetical protein [Pseudomonadota bacterium]
VPVGHVLAASGRSGPAAAFSCLTATVVVVGIIALVPTYGLLGAVATILAGMSTSLIFSLVARRALALKKSNGRWRFWAGVSLGAATQAGVLFLLASYVVDWWTLVLVGATGWAAFFLVRAIFKVLTPEEVRLLDQLRRIFPSPFKES